MVYKVIYKSSAEEDLERLPHHDSRRIIKKIDDYCRSENPIRYARKLKGFNIPTYRFRIGEYRALFRLDQRICQLVILLILRIAHRKEVYRDTD